MEKLIEIFKFIGANWEYITGIILALITVAELVTRITKTEKDDGAVQRVGSVIKKALDILKVPNNTK